MTCDEAEVLLHALIDGELDAGHAREVENHIAGCPRCAAALRDYREMSKAIAEAGAGYTAPAALRQRIEAALPQPRRAPNRRAVLRGFAMGSAVSALAATGLVAIVLRQDDVERIQSEVVSAHLRSLQAGHLTDVISTDQHTVKPWFNGKLDVSPPVIDLTAQGFTLIGGRLDYIDARAIGAVVYRRRQHVINLFVSQTSSTERRPAKIDTIQGFNIRHWSERGLNYWAVSDLAKDELADFGERFESAIRAAGIESRGAGAPGPARNRHQATFLSRLAMMSRRDLPLIARGRDLVVIGIGIVIGIRLIERPISRPAAKHVGIGMIERDKRRAPGSRLARTPALRSRSSETRRRVSGWTCSLVKSSLDEVISLNWVSHRKSG